MSGHMTRMSRGSSVGSSSRRPTSTSRITSTCRVAPWQACTWTDLSSLTELPGCTRARASGAALSRRSLLQPAEQGRRHRPTDGRGPDSRRRPPYCPSVRRSSRASRPSEASSGCPTYAIERSAERGTRPSSASRAELVPQLAGHLREPEVDVAQLGQGLQQLDLGAGHAGCARTGSAAAGRSSPSPPRAQPLERVARVVRPAVGRPPPRRACARSLAASEGRRRASPPAPSVS